MKGDIPVAILMFYIWGLLFCKGIHFEEGYQDGEEYEHTDIRKSQRKEGCVGALIMELDEHLQYKKVLDSTGSSIF